MAETVGRLDENLSDEDLELLKEIATVKAVQREVEQVEPQNEITLGELMKNFRARNGLTLKELAALLDCSFTFLSQIERGERLPSVKFAKRIAETINFSNEEELNYEQLNKRLVEAEYRFSKTQKALQEIAKFFGLTYDELLERFN